MKKSKGRIAGKKGLSAKEAATRLLAAAKKKDFAAMQSVLSQAPNLPAHDKKVLEAFIGSALSEDVSLVRTFLDHGIDINTRVNGHRLFVLAVMCPDTCYYKGLLKLGAEVNLPGTNDATPLIMAASTAAQVSDPETMMKRVRDLANRGADVNARDVTKRTALDYAFRSASVEVVQLLLKLGAKLKACDGRGWQCLQHSLDASDDSLLKLALKAGADPNWPLFGKKKPPVNYAAERGSVGKVKLLIRAGAPKKLPDGRDALQVAREKAKENAEAEENLFDMLERAEKLRAKLQKISAKIPGIKTDYSFGMEIGYFLGKTPCFCPYNDSLAVCLGKAAAKAALEKPGVHPFEDHRKVKPEWVLLSPEAIESDKKLKRWVEQAVDHVKNRKK